MSFKKWIRVGIVYGPGGPSLVTLSGKLGNQRYVKKPFADEEWFPRDAWPWFGNRLGRLSA